MKPIKHNFSSISKPLVILAGLALMFGLIFTVPTGVALAASPVATPHPKDYTALTQAFHREQDALSTQQANLGKTGTMVSKVQDLITKAQAKGVDTSALSAALATFQSQVSTAESSDTNAAGILSTHNGFDGNGNVTDPVAARQTVQDAHQALMDARNTLVQAVHDLHMAVRSWEEANKDKLQDQELQKDYQAEQRWLGIQQDNLTKANNTVSGIQDLITKAQAKGLDTIALQNALSTYQTQLQTAQASHTTAANILSSHNGFDGSGNVTDEAAARETVKDAHQALSDARTDLVQAVSDLKKAVDAWKDQNHIPTATPGSSGS